MKEKKFRKKAPLKLPKSKGVQNRDTHMGTKFNNKLENMSIEQLRLINEQITTLNIDQKLNHLDYMQWDVYKEQNRMREAVLERMRTGEGPSIFVVFGGNRTGKTELGAGVVAQLFGEIPGVNIWCTTVSDLSIGVQQNKLSKLIRKRDIKYGEYNSVRGWKNKIVTSNIGGTMKFKTYEQGREAHQGDNLDLIWADEEMPWDIFQECLARLTDRGGVFVLTFTSLSGYTRLVQYLWGSEDKNILTGVLTLDMNPFIPKKFKDRYKETIDPDEWASRIEGKPHLKQGLVYKEFGEKNIVDDFDYVQLMKKHPGRFRITEGIDPHERTPHHWLRFMHDTSTDILYVVDELRAPKESMIIEDFAELIKVKRFGIEPDYCQIDTSSMKPDVITKVSDENNPEDVHTVRKEFFRCGIQTMLCSKDNALGINLVKDRLRDNRREKGETVSKPKLMVMRKLSGLVKEFREYAWDSYQSAKVEERKELINKPLKKNDHFLDILKYEVIRKNDGRGTKFKLAMRDEIYGDMGY
jgi:phage terminase large subunit-like protein